MATEIPSNWCVSNLTITPNDAGEFKLYFAKGSAGFDYTGVPAPGDPNSLTTPPYITFLATDTPAQIQTKIDAGTIGFPATTIINVLSYTQGVILTIEIGLPSADVVQSGGGVLEEILS